ncbi:NUDIX domain-containing protein [Aestuariispira insulae]|uniref:NUDIX domain-containing protein n=1 Tax=Aestuariispira insulae TaxID=1461337 RepID=A0A3D9HNM9_9PROT|nr:NUDIX hydrolase [Aestuariispira insulae]RED50901.1 NUDIX domain-containing protein [Aestuariispira insulae]
MLLRDNRSTGHPEFLMGRRLQTLRFMPGFLVFPGGRVEDNEDPKLPILTALRECHEETGWHLSNCSEELPRYKEIARAITPKESPIRFDTRFYMMDPATFTSNGNVDGELEAIGWYDPHAENTRQWLADITAAVMQQALHHHRLSTALVDTGPVPLFTYGTEGLEISWTDSRTTS